MFWLRRTIVLRFLLLPITWPHYRTQDSLIASLSTFIIIIYKCCPKFHLPFIDCYVCCLFILLIIVELESLSVCFYKVWSLKILSRIFYFRVIERKSIDHTEIAITRLHLIPSKDLFPRRFIYIRRHVSTLRTTQQPTILFRDNLIVAFYYSNPV